MIHIKTVKEMKTYRKSLPNKKIGFIPTMGALHEGHCSLIEKSKIENYITVVSIYLNETQFNNADDLKKYPSSLKDDLAILGTLAVDGVFLPTFEDIYPDNFNYKITENKLSLDLCGKDRPGHFDGVLTVVLKLFNIVQPTSAYFGEKDFQQLSLIQGMVESLFIDIQIVSCPTKRDEEGLALSSRNKRLSARELEKARLFAKNLKDIKSLDDLSLLLEKNEISIDYIKDINSRRFAAVKVGPVRLIDNVSI